MHIKRALRVMHVLGTPIALVALTISCISLYFSHFVPRDEAQKRLSFDANTTLALVETYIQNCHDFPVTCDSSQERAEDAVDAFENVLASERSRLKPEVYEEFRVKVIRYRRKLAMEEWRTRER